MPRKKKARSPNQVFASELRHVRNLHGWSQQRLADEMRAEGFPIARSVLAKIESGARPVSLDEAVALAIALNVSPKALILPHEEGGEIALTPRSQLSAGGAASWFKGVPLRVGTGDEWIEDVSVIAPDAEAMRMYEQTTTHAEWRAQRRPQIRAIQVWVTWLEDLAAHDDIEGMRAILPELEASSSLLRAELNREEAGRGEH